LENKANNFYFVFAWSECHELTVQPKGQLDSRRDRNTFVTHTNAETKFEALPNRKSWKISHQLAQV